MKEKGKIDSAANGLKLAGIRNMGRYCIRMNKTS